MMDKNILYHFFDGSATDHEVGQVRAWVESSPEHQRELFRERKLFDSLTLLAEIGKQEAKAQQTTVSHSQQGRVIRLRIPQIAAMLAVVFALGMLVNLHTGKNQKPQTASWYETLAPLGAKSQVCLIDGTKVWLNAGSRLQYSTAFGQQNREVRLEGEAYFEVAKNETLPFEVTTSGIKVKAIGTAFNVKAYPDEATIETILVEGSVEVSKIGKADETIHSDIVLLQPEQRLTLKKNTNEMLVETKVQGKTEEKEKMGKIGEMGKKGKIGETGKVVETATDFMIQTSWKDKRWRIESEELGSFVTKLERRYNVKIDFEDNDLPKYKFNGTFEDEPIEEVLRALSLAAPVSFSLKGNQVTLSLNNKFEQQHQALYEPSL